MYQGFVHADMNRFVVKHMELVCFFFSLQQQPLAGRAIKARWMMAMLALHDVIP